MKRLSSLIILLYSSILSAQIMFDTIDGHHISLESLANKTIIINYWAEWCQPCVEEIQALNRFYQIHGQSIALFAVNFDQPSLSNQREAAKAHHIDYPSLATDPAEQLAIGDISVVPATFIVDHHGKVVKSLYGPQTFESLSKALKF